MPLFLSHLRLYHKFLLLPIVVWQALCSANIYATDLPRSAYIEREEVALLIQQLESEYHFNSSILKNIFTQARHKQSIIDAMDRPYQTPPPWYRYAPPLLSAKRQQQGIVFWKNYQSTLNRAETTFGVPQQVIISIIGIETFYGQVMGNYRLIDALSTLAFDYPRRGDFFKEELKQFLLMARNQHIDPLTIKGSFAGAIGIPQFMPSSYQKFGIDFNQDGHINLWDSPEDAIGSVAYFLQEHGWKANSWVTHPIGNIPESFLNSYAEEKKGMSEWRTKEQWLEALKHDNLPSPFPENMPLSERLAIIRLELSPQTVKYAWAGSNFEVITRYNRSRLYASAIWTLSCQLAEAKGYPACTLDFSL